MKGIGLKQAQRRLKKVFGERITVTEQDGTRFVRGEAADWQEAVRACQMVVSRDKQVHVVNDLTLPEPSAPMVIPRETDLSLEGMSPDVLIIGGGISGASIARELSRYDISVLLVDKESDLAMGASGRNDGEVHPGVDLNRGTLKQRYVLKGNAMYDEVCRELDVPFRRCGQVVGFTQGWLKPFMRLYAWQRRLVCHVPGTRLLNHDEMLKKEPEINHQARFALYSPTAGVVCPYGLTIAYGENAVQNGVQIMLNTSVTGMTVASGCITAVHTNRGTLHPRIVINAAGVFAEEVARMAEDRFFSIHPRRGTNAILDKKAAGQIRSIATLKGLHSNSTHTKGGGLVHTIDDNLLVGPDAVETPDKEDTATHAESIRNIFDKQRKASPLLKEADIIAWFTGIRAATFEEDFILEQGRKTRNILHVAGIQSPGLTTAPAIAVDMARKAVDMLGGADLKPHFDPTRKAIPRLRDMGDAERSDLIAQRPDYGEIVCRCEEISRGEIIDALRRPLCVPTVDGVKKRVRPGMGRCQGGFCAPLVTAIIAEEMGISPEEVRKAGAGSELLVCRDKEADT